MIRDILLMSATIVVLAMFVFEWVAVGSAVWRGPLGRTIIRPRWYYLCLLLRPWP